MEAKDFIKLRCKIHEDFKKWFSYSRKHHCLYSDWLPTECEHRDLINYVGSDFLVVVSLPFSTFIIPVKK